MSLQSLRSPVCWLLACPTFPQGRASTEADPGEFTIETNDGKSLIFRAASEAEKDRCVRSCGRLF